MHVRRFLRILIVLLTVIAIGMAWTMFPRSSATPSSPAFSSSSLVAYLKECSDLVVVRAPITTVIEQQDEGMLGSAQALLAVTAWLDVGCDLQQAKILSSDNASRTIRLSLPAPRILAVRLDAQRTKVYDLRRSGFWTFIPGSKIELDLVNRSVQAATTGVIDQPATEALVHLARERIRAELQRLASGSGWNVEVDWQS